MSLLPRGRFIGRAFAALTAHPLFVRGNSPAARRPAVYALGVAALALVGFHEPAPRIRPKIDRHRGLVAGASLNGYRIGTYVAEHLTEFHDRPEGFVEVWSGDVDLMVSDHFRLGDFITHDTQDAVWPKYVALHPRLLDKLELVLSTIEARTKVAVDSAAVDEVAFDVHSGFRTPDHNRGVPLAARDSRHQYGDAADLAIDADGDGRVTLKDELLVAQAVEEVEAEHPELVGGLGLYTSRRYATPYVHIDARGIRSRWTG